MTNPRIDIIAANPDWYAIFDSEGELFIGEAIVAWRITTEPIRDEMYSYTMAIGMEGDIAENCVGFQQPNGAVEVSGTSYKSFEEAVKDYAEKRRKP